MRSNKALVRGFIRENLVFLLLSLLVISTGTIALIFSEKGDLVLYFAENRSDGTNFLFKYGTKLGEELAFLGITILFLFIRFRHALAVPLLGIIVTVVSFGLKKLFHHDRPRSYFEDLGVFSNISLVPGVDVHGGATSFPSGHTMAGFALFAFTAFCLKEKRYGPLMFALAFIVGVSRVYLVQHFLEDIVFGAFLGILIASVLYWWHLKWGKSKEGHWLDRSILKK